MSRIILIVALTGLIISGCRPANQQQSKFSELTATLYDAALAPFYHGVASGDPLNDRVIIWTRVTPTESMAAIPIEWEVAATPGFETIVRKGSVDTNAERDYTVKVDVDGLQPGMTYYYRFSALGKTSVAGRTKTLAAAADRVKFAVVSCANWEAGFFNAYEKISQRDDVDAVIHLGDFIYEYARSNRGEAIGRYHLPEGEIITLSDYRTRYAQYRLDQGLSRMSQQHPLIAIWDDHEVANDSYSHGAQNHQPNEGDYEKRKAVARQAYYEWIPIREGNKHYRSFSYGNLVDLIMLDERLEGRTKPVDSISDPNYLKEDRSMLGPVQLEWFETRLKASRATWKVIGNQVIFADIFYSKNLRRTTRNLDSWDGFPAEKKRVIEFISTNQISDLIFITGDSHASWANEITDGRINYDPVTSAGSLAVEFGTTSVSSGNLDERFPVEQVKSMEAELQQLNPQVKYHNNRDHGYLLLTLYPEKAEGEWYYMKNIRTPQTEEFIGEKISVQRGTAHLKN